MELSLSDHIEVSLSQRKIQSRERGSVSNSEERLDSGSNMELPWKTDTANKFDFTENEGVPKINDSGIFRNDGI